MKLILPLILVCALIVVMFMNHFTDLENKAMQREHELAQDSIIKIQKQTIEWLKKK